MQLYAFFEQMKSWAKDILYVYIVKDIPLYIEQPELAIKWTFVRYKILVIVIHTLYLFLIVWLRDTIMIHLAILIQINKPFDILKVRNHKLINLHL